MDRAELKRRIVVNPETGREDYRRLQVRCVRKFGPAGGLFLAQLVFWEGLGRLPGAWIWKTQNELQRETGLSRHHQQKARKRLVGAGVVEEVRRGIPARMHFRLDLSALEEVLNDGISTTSDATVPEAELGVGATPHVVQLGRQESPSSSATMGGGLGSQVNVPDKLASQGRPTIQRSRQEPRREEPREDRPVQKNDLNSGAETVSLRDGNPNQPESHHVRQGQPSVPFAGWPVPKLHPPPPTLDRREESAVWQLLLCPNATKSRRLALAHVAHPAGEQIGHGPVIARDVAEAVRAELGGASVESYLEAVERGLRELRQETGEGVQA